MNATRWISGLLIAVAMTGSAFGKVAVGDVPPDVLGRDVDGKDILISGYRGKVVVVTFWASWCDYCLKEMPILEALQRVAGKERLEVVAVNFKEDRQTFRAIVPRLKKWTLTLTNDSNGRVSDAYGVVTVPHLFMIDKMGKVGYIYSGYSEAELPHMVDAANGLLEKPAIPNPTP